MTQTSGPASSQDEYILTDCLQFVKTFLIFFVFPLLYIIYRVDFFRWEFLNYKK